MNRIESPSLRIDKRIAYALVPVVFALLACSGSLAVESQISSQPSEPLEMVPVAVPQGYGIGQLAQECGADLALTQTKNPNDLILGQVVLLYFSGGEANKCLTPQEYLEKLSGNCTFKAVASDALDNQGTFAQRVGMNEASFVLVNNLSNGSALALGSYRGNPICQNGVDPNDVLHAGGR
ncbi:hypothetical protein CO051_06815 [Candidatus Roizmanbacteria bacterium CG_4_9_14_0_2_um_filter_39_13]|uniref:Lipoprotein n=1 Tax=Candidatus Roizmanbacteria bacterium CG_4_9_14_0_2_um_filter_39_13 TaxID=1974839 RepID=A0A2M8EWH0_9BACT|nr:MAG: hypothetical protein CO051_06815 [Candidatus Roizmanbacteria bacterium CG_4_9_14_0_2_um_filter_39_13]